MENVAQSRMVGRWWTLDFILHGFHVSFQSFENKRSKTQHVFSSVLPTLDFAYQREGKLSYLSLLVHLYPSRKTTTTGGVQSSRTRSSKSLLELVHYLQNSTLFQPLFLNPGGETDYYSILSN